MADPGFRSILGVLISPTATFRALRERPTWLAAFVVVLVATVAIGQLAQAKIDPEQMFRDMLGRGGATVDEARLEELIERQEGQNPVVGVIASAAVTAVIPIFCALYFWIATRLFGGEPSFHQSLSTVLHALIPWWVVKGLLSVPAFLSRDALSVEEASSGLLPSNLGFLLGEESPLLLRGLASALDIFALWGLFLLVLGFSVVSRISKAASGALAFVVWLAVFGVGLLPLLLPKLLGGG